MCHFLVHYTSKIPNYLNCAILEIFWADFFLMFQFLKLVNLLIQYYPFSKGKNGKESPFAAEHIQAGRFLLFQAMIGYISSNHGACYIKQTEHRSQRPAARTPGMLWWFAMFVNDFCNDSPTFCCENVLYLREKISIHLSSYEKKKRKEAY